MKKIYSISHNDLDGYGCQLVLSKKYPNLKTFNVSYGKPISKALKAVIRKIKGQDKLFITDLNLDFEQAELIDNAQKRIGFTLVLIDHHEKGKNIAKKYDWYHLDTSVCATKLTYNYIGEPEEIRHIVELVNSYDMWLEDNDNFDRAKSLNQIIWNHKNLFPSVLKGLENQFFLYMLESYGKLLEFKIPLGKAESLVYELKRKYFDSNKDENKGFQMVFVEYLYHKVLPLNLHLKFNLDGYRGIAFYGLDSIFQDFSNILLKEGDFDFAVNIYPSGKVSLRSRNDTNVNELASRYFRGGGHPNAAGGTIENYNEKEVDKNPAIAYEFLKDCIR